MMVSLFYSSSAFHERMLDDMDDVHSVHSIGVVENPLYADEAYAGPRYADLDKKDQEAEVSDLTRYLLSQLHD